MSKKIISRIKDSIDKLGDIGQKISSTDLVTIMWNSMLKYYHMFITCCTSWEIAPTFDGLIGILMQEEECRENLNFRSENLD